MRTGNEYGPVFTAGLEDIIQNSTNIISISVDAFFPEIPEDAVVVCEIRSKGELVHWRSVKFSDFISQPHSRETVFMTLKLADMNLNHPGLMLKIYIWNKSLENFYFDNFTVRVRKGNPYIYGLFEKIN